MPRPTTYDDEFVKGDDYSISWTMSTKDVNGVKTPLDLTGSTGAGKIRSTPTQAGTLIGSFTFDNSQLASGIPIFTLAAATTATFASGTYYYDLELTIAGKKRTWVSGKLTVLDQVTD